MKPLIGVLCLSLLGCTSQHEKEAERLYLDALSLESRNTHEDLSAARAIYSRIARDYIDTAYFPKARERWAATNDRWKAGSRLREVEMWRETRPAPLP